MRQTIAEIVALLTTAADDEDVWRTDSGLIEVGNPSGDATWIGNVAEIRAEYEQLREAE